MFGIDRGVQLVLRGSTKAGQRRLIALRVFIRIGVGTSGFLVRISDVSAVWCFRTCIAEIRTSDQQM